MQTAERAAQIWLLLLLSARNHQTLTYGMLAELIGVSPVGLGQLLEPVQSYCLLKSVPPLIVLVVSSKTVSAWT
jgi:hypothetical protein